MYIRKLTAAIALLVSVLTAYAAIPSGYYSTCENLNGSTLLTALCTKISSHTAVGYSGLWAAYKSTDVKSNGKIWDIYSTKEWTYSSDQCGNYSQVGDCYNREHTIPQSWFNQAAPMVSDLFHIYPTDGKVNGQRADYPFGECASGTTLASNGTVKALGKLGTCTFSGYTGKVFEPDDQYKGDIARSYFYMAAAYNDKIASWSGAALAGNKYPAFTTWTVNLMLKWHRADPVSQKELDRNEAIYKLQKNRNPFIDHPELVEYIWGDKKTSKWSENAGTGSGDTPTTSDGITAPKNGSTVAFGTITLGQSVAKTIVVKASNVTVPIYARPSAGYKVDKTTVSYKTACTADGAPVVVTCTPTAVGTANGTLTLVWGTNSVTVNLTAKCVADTPAEPSVTISSASGQPIALHSTAGVESEAVELLIDAENVTDKIVLNVKVPFEISPDKTTWTRQKTIAATVSHIYLRVASDDPGEFTSYVRAKVGTTYSNSTFTVTATVDDALPTFTETFEPYSGGRDNTYVAHDYPGAACEWSFTDAGIWSTDAANGGDHAMRMGSTTSSTIATKVAKSRGVGIVSFYAHPFNKDAAATIAVETSTDGKTWTTDGTADIAKTGADDGLPYSKYTVTVKRTGNRYLRLRQTAGKRVVIDDLTATDFTDMSTEITDPTDTYSTWTAYCRGRQLVVETQHAVDMAVHGIDGVTYKRCRIEPGQTTFDMAPGFYIVAIDGQTRTVLIN